jgi:hypothetical protein
MNVILISVVYLVSMRNHNCQNMGLDSLILSFFYTIEDVTGQLKILNISEPSDADGISLVFFSISKTFTKQSSICKYHT